MLEALGVSQLFLTENSVDFIGPNKEKYRSFMFSSSFFYMQGSPSAAKYTVVNKVKVALDLTEL